jgi:hypothetical protein
MEFDEDLSGSFFDQRKAAGKESRASRLSTVERRIIKDSDQCPQCVANDDPRNVPVHPNCHCDVVTDSVETGTAEPTSRFLETLTRDVIEMDVFEAEIPEAVQLNPETVALFDSENVRYADLARWLEQIEPYLNQADNYVAIVVDDDSDEAAAQLQESIEAIAEDLENFNEEFVQNKKLWFSIAQAVI